MKKTNLDLFSQEIPVDSNATSYDWPDSGRFPLNIGRNKVKDLVLNDLAKSKDPLIVTGYASLDKLIDLIAKHPKGSHVRILLGYEPFTSQRKSYEVRGYSFPREVEKYWLNRGISLLLSAKLIKCIERLEARQVQARYLSDAGRRLHAKIYVGEESATLGSSNFTGPGLESQLEANSRFSLSKESRRYTELQAIAENYWSLGKDYNAELVQLLGELLRKVSWQEALARACAELLEGDWAKEFIRERYLPGEADLWPAQRQGIAQTLYVLSRQGSVLIADATGSGKTRMGVNLISAILDQIAQSGRIRRGKALMVCPPVVEENWKREATFADTPLETYSHGALSHAHSEKHDLTMESLRRAQVLCVDEGHNFLNIKSNRTQNLLRNMADHVLLFTATPINRSVIDLLRIADMLGADNLNPSTLEAFKKMLGVKNINRTLTVEEIQALRTEIQKFTVRRTKKMLNELIDREPDKYRDKAGRPCRFPQHQPKIYALKESDEDRALAREIRKCADELYAVSHFRQAIEMPEVLARQGRTEESFLNSRLSSAKKIARYVIMASLRSSRLALAEHIVGTGRAIEEFDLKGFHKQTETGNMLASLEMNSGTPPENRLSIPLPVWLSDADAFAAACDHDRRIYERIYGLLRRMSDARERAKAAKLLELMKGHSLILAFDRSPITLEEIRRHIGSQDPEQHVAIATGDPRSDRSEILKGFKWGSSARNIIGLCSDSLAEGVNLQQASCIVHLDMPSVVRIAEQRAGRVDRMDSPHATIEAWWPQDADEFALSSDDRFVERYETVESLLGSNMPLPDDMLSESSKPLSVGEVIKEYENLDQNSGWDRIHDAFEPVRQLVNGTDSLISGRTYESYRRVTARILARVSVVRTDKPWAFFCLSGGTFRAPHWVLFTSPSGRPVTDLGDICAGLRERLSVEIEDLPMDEKAAEHLERYISRLSATERELLPRKKQRALEEMEKIIAQFAKNASARQEQTSVDHYQAILNMIQQRNSDHQPDWDEVAALWLDLIRPVWYERLKLPRNKPLLLKDIRKDLVEKEEALGPQILEKFCSFPVLPSPDERISACILGLARSPV